VTRVTWCHVAPLTSAHAPSPHPHERNTPTSATTLRDSSPQRPHYKVAIERIVTGAAQGLGVGALTHCPHTLSSHSPLTVCPHTLPSRFPHTLLSRCPHTLPSYVTTTHPERQESSIADRLTNTHHADHDRREAVDRPFAQIPPIQHFTVPTDATHTQSVI